MARVHGIAGEWARVKGSVIGLWPVFLGLFILGFATALMGFVSLPVGLVLIAVSAVVLVACGRRGLARVESFYKGARGEERVAGILRGLPDTFHLFNDFMACGTRVDHVVVGPVGVFAIETKCWSGLVTVEENMILVNGGKPSRPPLDQAVREARLVQQELAKRGWEGPVTPVLAFASDNFSAHCAEIGNAVVINSCDLGTSFASGRRVLGDAELARLVGLIEY